MVQDGKRIPLDPDDPSQAQMRSDWMDLYDANNKAPPPATSSTSKPVGCSARRAPESSIVRHGAIEPDNTPVPSALVKADGLQKLTDETGRGDFGMVDAKTYELSANKEGYTPWAVSGDLAQPDSATVTVAPQGLTTAELGLQSCITHRLAGKPILIAMAAEDLTEPIQTLDVAGSVGEGRYL